MNGWIGLLLVLLFLVGGAGAIAWSAGTRRRAARDQFVVDLRTIDEWERRRAALRVIRDRDAGAAQLGHVIGAWLVVLLVLAAMALGGALVGVAS